MREKLANVRYALGNNWLTILTVALTVVLFAVGIWIDHVQTEWLASHPITSNLIAGLLGLPAAFLIVNLAAERAIAWNERRKWRLLREIEIKNVLAAHQSLEPDLGKMFHFSGEIQTVDEDFKAHLRAVSEDLTEAALKREIEGGELDIRFLISASVVEDACRFAHRATWLLDEARRMARQLLPPVERVADDPIAIDGLRRAIADLDAFCEALERFNFKDLPTTSQINPYDGITEDSYYSDLTFEDATQLVELCIRFEELMHYASTAAFSLSQAIYWMDSRPESDTLSLSEHSPKQR